MADEALLEELLSLWQREAEQGRYLAAADLCRDHPEWTNALGQRIEGLQQMNRLLQAGATPPQQEAPDRTLPTSPGHGQPGPAQEQGADTPPLASSLGSDSSALPEPVPGYAILAELGRGGFGAVYKAQQISLNRLVALKMDLAGSYASAEERSRFRTEAEIIARLQHPNIVQIHEVGEHHGRLFFSLELCPGGNLEKKLAGTPLPPEEAAQLVEALARTMQAAHEKGVVHRDLKPANVLLAEDGTPKVTDFGLAKKLGEAGQTVSGAVMGTPPYMAPEQVLAQKGTVGPATDVYALGAILYECLTGRPPFRAATTMETLEQVCGAEPAAPRLLQPGVPRDLETICLKCLGKEPGRRYASAQELAEDLRRMQAGEPIRARPVSRVERGWRWCRRNPVVAVLAASLSAVLIGSLIGLTSLWLQADREREQAQRERDQTAAARKEAVANLDQANRNFQLAQQSVDRNLTEVSEDALLNEPGFQPLRKRLLQGSRDFYQRLIEQRQGDPALRAGLAAAYERLAVITSLIDAKEEAIAHQREAVRLFDALWAEDPDNVSMQTELSLACANLGNLYLELDQVRQAEGPLCRGLDLGERLLAAHPNTPTHVGQLLPALIGLGHLHLKTGNLVEAEKLFTRARQAFQDLPAKDRESKAILLAAATLQNLSILYWQTNRSEESIPLLQQARDLLIDSMKRGPDKLAYASMLAGCLTNLAVTFRRVNRENDAEKTYQEAEDLWKELTRKNPLASRYQLNRASNLYNMGNLLRGMNRLAKVEESYQQARAMQERLAADYPSLAEAKRDLTETYTSLAGLYEAQGRRDEAERMFHNILEAREQLCKEYPDTLDFHLLLANSLGTVARFYREGGQATKAEVAYRRRITIYERIIEKNPRNPEYQCSLGLNYNDLGRLYRPLGRTAEAEKAYLQALVLQEKLVRENPKVEVYRVDLATTQNNLGNLFRQAGKKDKSEAYYRDAIRGHESLVHDHPEVPYYARELARTYGGLAQLLLATGRPADAEPLFRQAADVLGKLVESQPREPAYRYERAETLINLCEIYKRSNRNAEAELVCKEILPQLERLTHENPKLVRLAYLLGSAQWQMGEAVSVPGRDPGEAIRWYGQAINTLNAVAQKAPQDVDIRQVRAAAHESRSKQLLELARATAALRDLDRAIELSTKPALILTLGQGAARIVAKDHTGNAAKADELASQPKASAFLAYNAACVNARSAAVVREDKKLSAAEIDKLSEQYAAKALEWLRKARAAGYFRDTADVKGLKTESDLACLRDRDDFKSWLTELGKGP
jgi:serine/threonine protein kinase